MAEEIHIEETEIKIVASKKSLWGKIVDWWGSLFTNEYEVTVWFHAGALPDAEGKAVPRSRSKKVFVLKSIAKKSDRHILGEDVFGKPFEIKTVEPFDYFIRKVK